MGSDPDCQILIRALHKLQLLSDGLVGVLLQHLLCLMRPSTAKLPDEHTPGGSRTHWRACIANLAVLHDMLAEQLVDVLVSAVASLSRLPGRKEKVWVRLAAEWRELDSKQWQADPVAAVLAARAAAADALLRQAEPSLEAWQPSEDRRLPPSQRRAKPAAGGQGGSRRKLVCFCSPGKLACNMGWAPAAAAAWRQRVDRPQGALQAAITCRRAACPGRSICRRLPWCVASA